MVRENRRGNLEIKIVGEIGGKNRHILNAGGLLKNEF